MNEKECQSLQEVNYLMETDSAVPTMTMMTMMLSLVEWKHVVMLLQQVPRRDWLDVAVCYCCFRRCLGLLACWFCDGRWSIFLYDDGTAKVIYFSTPSSTAVGMMYLRSWTLDNGHSPDKEWF